MKKKNNNNNDNYIITMIKTILTLLTIQGTDVWFSEILKFIVCS